MKLISVNVGKAQPIQNAKSSGLTGIFKLPQTGAIQIHSLGLKEDAICDTKHHGGVDQAVYIYGMTDYAWWEAELGRELSAGMFGENLTISDLESASFQIGDRLRIGTVLLEVTAPRIPCVTLAARMQDPHFVKRWRQAERPGLYCRVLEEGEVCEGDTVTIELSRDDSITAVEMFRLDFEKEIDESTLRRLLTLPVAIRARVDYERQLMALATS
jgi:MOSC domain-containing protein YiiM